MWLLFAWMGELCCGQLEEEKLFANAFSNLLWDMKLLFG